MSQHSPLLGPKVKAAVSGRLSPQVQKVSASLVHAADMRLSQSGLPAAGLASQGGSYQSRYSAPIGARPAERRLEEQSQTLASLCTDQQQLNQLQDLRSKLQRTQAEIQLISAQIQEYELIGGNDRPGALLVSGETASVVASRIAEIEAHMHKLQTFEQTHLDSSVF